MTRLVLHIGDHKTATTAIQDMLARGLVGQGALVYPRLRGRGHHNHLARALRNREFAAEADPLFEELARQVAQAPREACVVLSGEEFERVPPRQVRDLFARHLPEQVETMEVLAYVRPHVGRIVASYAERVKQGFISMPLSEFVERNAERELFHYAPRLGRQSRVWGRQLTVRPMVPAALTGGSVVADFLARVLPDRAAPVPDLPRSNPTPSVADLAVLMALQARVRAALPADPSFAARESRRVIGWRMARLLAHSAPRPGGAPLRADAAVAGRIAELYRADAAAVDEAFFDGAPLEEALDAAVAAAPREAPGPERPEAHLPAESVRLLEQFAELVAHMYGRDPEGWAAEFKRKPLVLPAAPGTQ